MSQAVIADRTRTVRPADSQGTRLRVVPILGPSYADPPYRLLDEAALPHVTVTEISSAGSVPELLVRNGLTERLFLLDGQELVGAKQNRILNTDILVPPRGELKIPVSCVEQGRWHHTTSTFSPGKTASHRTRSGKSARVLESLRREEGHDADQSAVWAEVKASLDASAAASPTMALSDAYRQRSGELEAFRSGLHVPPESVGLAVFQGKRLRGLDLFDRHTTLAYFWASLVDSYAIDLLGNAAVPVPGGADAVQVAATLGAAAAGAWEPYRSPGEGEDFRLGGNAGLSGSALVWEKRSVVHLQLFPQYADERPQTGRAADRRPRIRRRWLDR